MKTSPQPGGTPSRSIILGTAGHIDHGKTALVLALTGTDTDRLPEEKTRGITIDLGFAALALQSGEGQRFDLSLIDVPGHHAFIRNMLAGAGGIDCVLLIIAADEGIKAQTREHLEICALLGITRGLAVLTKRDLVSTARLAEVRAEVQDLLAATPLHGAPVLAVSAVTGEGIPALKAALLQLVASVPQRNLDHVLRLPLDRAFTVRGFGTVVTGTLQGGRLRADHMLQLADRSLRVRGLQVHGRAQQGTIAPNRVALNLANVEVADIGRGDTLVEPDTLLPARTVDAELLPAAGMPLPKHRARVRFHAFTSETLATVLRYNESPGAALVRLRLDKPVVLAPGDRFVLRQPSPAVTLAGGRVLDAAPLARQRKASTHAWLQQLLKTDTATQLLLRVQRRASAGITAQTLVRETGLTPEALQRHLRALLAAGRLASDARGQQAPVHVIAHEALAVATSALLRELTRANSQPIAAAELRSRLRLSPWVFTLATERIARERPLVHTAQGLAFADSTTQSPAQSTAKSDAPSPAPSIPAGMQLSPRQQQVAQLYAHAGLASPIFSEAAAQLGMPPTELRPVLTALLRAGHVVRLGSDDLLVHRGALEQLTTNLRRHRGESFDVARFKSFTGLTRKHAIPMLEYLDGARITKNQNGVRTVL